MSNVAGIFVRNRFQLLGGMFFGVILPTIFHGEIKDTFKRFLSLEVSIIGMSCAFILGYLIMRRMTVMPSTLAITRVLPAYILSYSIVTTLFSGLRLEFSRWQFLISFSCVVVFFIFVLGVIQYVRRTTIGFIENEHALSLTKIKNINWIKFNSPADASENNTVPIVADLAIASDEWVRYLAEAAVQGRRIFNIDHLHESLTGKVKLEHLSENSMGHLAVDSLYAHSKHYLDFTLALIAITLLWPLFLIVSILIKLDSPGPVLFRQTRTGWKGVPFTVYKFRSMYLCDQAESDKHLQSHNKNRITRIGKIIRKTRIDELPQIINILRGEMSWIGPRPETRSLSDLYETKIPFYRYRHVVKPGITGWAQVNQGHVVNVEKVREKLRYDFYYVKHFSIWLDIIILFKTVRVVFSGFGAK